VSTAATYTRFELIRAARNIRFFAITLAFPLLLFVLVAGPNRHEELGGIPFPVYYMSGMVAWGTMGAVIGSGARIAAERQIGWNRQLRVTPLSARQYLRAKVATGYAVALVSIVGLYAAGAALGVRLPAERWISMTVMILVGLIPFAVLGIFLGHVISADSIGPAIGGVTSLFALLGGAYGPVAGDGVIRQLTELLPSYWLVQAGHIAVNGGPWPAKAWVVLVVWTVVFARLAARAWRRDTQRD
jgi:ABC-2 type transport system permease protein